ncbi:coniferyl alcohol acyltransferase [Oryza sativa Japonica Group]|uniref:coniferyl alcohol acyltransferase n=1 Tax=Oryza sativa subsp. japonica TaxID=39947 RepID=UPI0007754CE3
MATCINGGELQVRVVSRRLVQASDESLRPHVLAVSNLDLLPQSIQVSMICIYPNPPTSAGGFHDVVAAFAAGLPSLLNHFFPLADRIAVNPCSGLPEIHCYNQGAELVVGEADVALASLDYGRVGESIQKILLPYAGDVALSVQVVSFACGGFTVAWGTNHVVVDGRALSMLVGSWSELARSGTLAAGARPNHDRSVFRPRATPSYDASLDEAFTPLDGDGERQINVLTSDESFVGVRLYYIEAADIARLREQARATRVQAVSAYLWKALAAVVGSRDARCRMVWWVDGRRRLTLSSSPELRAAMRSYEHALLSMSKSWCCTSQRLIIAQAMVI